MKEALKGSESKQYYRGRTTDIIAIFELSQAGNKLFADQYFWEAYLVSMQVNVGNYQSKCATELIQFYDIQRNIYYEFASNVAYEKGRDQKETAVVDSPATKSLSSSLGSTSWLS